MSKSKIISIFIASFIVTFFFTNFGVIQSYFFFDGATNEDRAPVFPLSANKSYVLPLSAEISGVAETVEIVPLADHSNTSVEQIENYRLEIQKLNVSVPIVVESSKLQADIFKSLEKGVVHYAGSPTPGNWGTSIILGHSSTPWGYKGDYAYVFSKLDNLNEGDTFTIHQDGVAMKFKISKKIVFVPKTVDDTLLKQFEAPTGKSVVLMTCWPLGTNLKRIAVRGDLIE